MGRRGLNTSNEFAFYGPAIGLFMKDSISLLRAARRYPDDPNPNFVPMKTRVSFSRLTMAVW